MTRADRNTPEYRAKAAERMRRWRAENPQVHRDREAARYKRRRVVEPDKLRAQGAKNAKRWRENNPEKAKESRLRFNAKNPDFYKNLALRKKYGLTLDQFNEMLAKQNGQCAICNASKPNHGWCVDHSHQDGRVRGILCHPCNTALGFFKDNPSVLNNAIEYLATHGGKK